jgi:hypothetical protein
MAADFDFSPYAPYPRLAAADEAVRSRNWPGFRAQYDAVPDWNQRQRIMSVTDTMDQAEPFLKSVIEQDPDDLVATTMFGLRLVHEAWESRPAKLSRESLAAFEKDLRDAEEVLAWVCEEDETFVPAWVGRVSIAHGLALGSEEIRQRYDRAVGLDPHNLGAQRAFLQSLHPRSGGEFADLHKFAADCAAAAPPGAHNAVLVVEGHLEDWVDRRAQSYFDASPVWQEIVQAAHRSVLNSDFRRTIGWVEVASTFALGFTLLEEWSLAKRCFKALGTHASAGPFWGHLGPAKPEEEFAKARYKALDQG